MRRLGTVVGAVLLAALAVVAVIAFFGSRDKSQISHATGPGALQPDRGDTHLGPGARSPTSAGATPPTSGPHHVVVPPRTEARLSDDQILTALERGDVVLFYPGRRPPPGLAALARNEAGAFQPSVAAAGQAVILVHRPGVAGVVAAAWRHLLRASGASDPRLDDFVQFWLGRGAQG